MTERVSFKESIADKPGDIVFHSYGLDVVTTPARQHFTVITPGSEDIETQIGEPIGRLHFMAFGRRNNVFLPPPSFAIMSAYFGFSNYFAAVEKGDIPQPKLLYGETNREVSKLSKRLGFHDGGTVTYKNSRGEKEMHRVVGVFDEVKQTVENFPNRMSNDMLDRLVESAYVAGPSAWQPDKFNKYTIRNVSEKESILAELKREYWTLQSDMGMSPGIFAVVSPYILGLVLTRHMQVRAGKV